MRFIINYKGYERFVLMKRGIVLVTAFILAMTLLVIISAKEATNVTSPYSYSFSSSGILYEAGSDSKTTSPYWWLNSGAELIIENGSGKTIQGNLISSDKWRLIYANSNPLDTDKGYHPQNIFRLYGRSLWTNYKQTAYFKINKDQLSLSPNRDGHNGLLLMNRIQDGNNLYYSGIRVDGQAIIKKKQNGIYYTLASSKVYNGTYDRTKNPSLLPKNKWIGLRSEINTSNGITNIKLYMDEGKKGIWKLLLNVNDTKSSQGTPITSRGRTGIRTDFMDVEFDDYSVVGK